MISTDYLDSVLHACARERNATRAPAGQAATFDILMGRAFEMQHADLCTHLKTARTQTENARTELDQLSQLGFFGRFSAGKSLSQAKAEFANRQREEAIACKFVDDVKRDFYADITNKALVSDLEQQLDEAARRQFVANDIAKRVAVMQADLVRYEARFPGAPSSISFPSLPLSGTDAAIVGKAGGVLDQIEASLAQMRQRLELVRPAAAKASAILDTFLADSRSARRPADESFVRRCRNSLDALTGVVNYPSLEQQLKACTWPDMFLRRADWLVLWSALQAGIEYNNLADGSAANEGPKVGWWCGQWQNAIAQWDRATLRALGLSQENVSNALFSLENTAMESRSGADVLIVLAVSDGNSHHCSIVGVQFKRGGENSCVIPLSQSDGTQYDALARHFQASNGRWHGLYASLQRDGGGLSSVPAVAIEATFVPAQQDISNFTYEVRKNATDRSSVDWRVYGESLPTALATRLGGASAAFESVDAAFDWAEQNGINNLPAYVLIQAVGESARALYRASERVKNLAHRSGQTYELVDSLERRRALGVESEKSEPERDNGMGL